MGFFVSPLDALFRVSDFLGGGVASTPTLDSQDDGSLFQVSSLNGLQCPFFGSFDIITFQSVLGEGWWSKSRSFSEFFVAHSFIATPDHLFSMRIQRGFLRMFQLQHWQFFSFSLGFLFCWKPCAAGFFLQGTWLGEFWGKYWSQPLDPNMFFLTSDFLGSRVLADGVPWGCLGSWRPGTLSKPKQVRKRKQQETHGNRGWVMRCDLGLFQNELPVLGFDDLQWSWLCNTVRFVG